MRKLFRDNSASSLIEVMASLIIASILIWGVVTAYEYGVRLYDSITSKYLMQNEGSIKLRFIEAWIRMADVITINEYNEANRTKLTTRLPDTDYDGHVDGNIEFFTNTRDGSLRMNDRRLGKNNFNVRVLPITTLRVNRRDPYGRFPYRIRSVRFSRGDDDIEGYTPTPGAQDYVVNIDIILEDDNGNTVALSSSQSKLNK